MTTDNFNLTRPQAEALAAEYGTPLFVYDRGKMEANADLTQRFSGPFGLTVRFAMKALPTAAVLRLFEQKGLHFDASSGPEVHRLLRPLQADRPLCDEGPPDGGGAAAL